MCFLDATGASLCLQEEGELFKIKDKSLLQYKIDYIKKFFSDEKIIVFVENDYKDIVEEELLKTDILVTNKENGISESNFVSQIDVLVIRLGTITKDYIDLSKFISLYNKNRSKKTIVSLAETGRYIPSNNLIVNNNELIGLAKENTRNNDNVLYNYKIHSIIIDGSHLRGSRLDKVLSIKYLSEIKPFVYNFEKSFILYDLDIQDNYYTNLIKNDKIGWSNLHQHL